MRRRHVVTAAGVVLATAGAASAYLTGGGSGTATAASEQPTAVTLAPGAPGAPLHPGGTVDLVLTATNNDGSAAILGRLALDTARGDGGFAVDVAHAGCPASSFALSAASDGESGDGWTVPGSSTLDLVLPDALTMGTDAPDACQGASVQVYLRAAP